MDNCVFVFDFDDTLTRSPAALGAIAQALSCRNSKVYIVTGRPESEKERVLKSLHDLGLDYTVFDDIIFYPEEYVMSQFNRNLLDKISEWKSYKCKELDADIIFEDNVHIVSYLKAISPKTLLLLLI